MNNVQLSLCDQTNLMGNAKTCFLCFRSEYACNIRIALCNLFFICRFDYLMPSAKLNLSFEYGTMLCSTSNVIHSFHWQRQQQFRVVFFSLFLSHVVADIRFCSLSCCHYFCVRSKNAFT